MKTGTDVWAQMVSSRSDQPFVLGIGMMSVELDQSTTGDQWSEIFDEAEE